MMFIVPIVLETTEDDLPFVLSILRDTQKGEYHGVKFSVTGFGNTLPVPVGSEQDFRNQLNKRRET